MIKHLTIKIHGKVQGVFYRANAKKEAEKLHLKGIAQNEPDKTVYMEVEGTDANLLRFLEWCKVGSSRAKVDKIEVKEGKVKKYPDFSIQ